MMHLKQFTHWAATPKNGGLDAVEAQVEFSRLCSLPTVVLDEKGVEKYRRHGWSEGEGSGYFQGHGSLDTGLHHQ